MTGSKGTWLTAMKQTIRSPSPARGFHPSSTPATPHRQSVDNFLARLGDLYETAVKSEDKSAPLDPPRRNVRRSPRRDPLKGQQAVDPKEQPAVQEFKVQETALARQKGLIRAQEEQNKHARAAAAASAAAAESAAAAAQAAAEIVRLTYAGSPKFEPPVEKSREEHAATKIQAAFRGHLARQALRALRGLVKLQAVVRGHLVRRQARIALSCMQALVRLQARVRARQVTTLENSTIVENIVNAQLDSPKIKVQQMQVRREAHVKQQRKLHEIPAQKLQDSRSSYRSEMRSNCSQLDDRSGTWDNSVFSKEELQCKILKKQNAAAVRQRTMAYAEMRQSGGRTPRRGAAAGSYAVEETRKAMVEADNEEMARYSLDEMVMEAEEAMAGGDWSWLEGWMSSQGVALWERNSFRSTSTSSAFITNNLINNNCFDDMIQNQNDHEEEPALKIIEVDRSASYPNFNKPPPPPLLLAPPPPPRRRSSITPTRAHFPSSSSSSTVSRVNNYGSRSPIPPPRRRTP